MFYKEKSIKQEKKMDLLYKIIDSFKLKVSQANKQVN